MHKLLKNKATAMSTLLIFSFDGTSNEPRDAEQSVNKQGIKEDDSITNIVKFHLL